MKFSVGVSLLIIISAVLVTGQSYNRQIQQRTQRSRNRSERQGRTLGILGPLVGLGASRLGNFGSFNLVGYDPSIAPYRQRVPVSAFADPYYDAGSGYNRYGGYKPSSYLGYTPSYSGYKPSYGLSGLIQQFAFPSGLSYGGYRPAVFPGIFDPYAGYPADNFQSPAYGGSATATSSPLGSTLTSSVSSPSAGTAAAPPASSLSGAQASQVANLLGQLLGQQLRPIVNGATASDEPNSKRLFL